MAGSAPDVDEARRSALLKMGRFAAYTAPVMTTLLVANRAAAAASPGGCRGVNQGTSDQCSNPNPHFGNNENPVHGN
ncbi:MAG TPA: hypothetical protein VFZ01_06400 [Geminicoccaceae bacterium]